MKARQAASGVRNAGANAPAAADAERLYRKYGPMVTRRCRLLLGDAADAADAAQDVFVKLITGKGLMKTAYPSSLLFKMATNHCLNMLRDKRRHGGNEDGETLLEKIACLSPDNDTEARTGFRRTLDKLFDRHPESSRTIAVLHLLDGMTLEETARETGMSVSGIKKRLKALKDNLKEINI